MGQVIYFLSLSEELFALVSPFGGDGGRNSVKIRINALIYFFAKIVKKSFYLAVTLTLCNDCRQ